HIGRLVHTPVLGIVLLHGRIVDEHNRHFAVAHLFHGGRLGDDRPDEVKRLFVDGDFRLGVFNVHLDAHAFLRSFCISGYSMRGWNIPFNRSQMASATRSKSRNVKSHSSNWPSSSRSLMILRTSCSMRPGSNLDMERTAASTESQMPTMAVSRVCAFGPG